jgi:hypothetical protein
MNVSLLLVHPLELGAALRRQDTCDGPIIALNQLEPWTTHIGEG